jgi:hypothetical protein
MEESLYPFPDSIIISDRPSALEDSHALSNQGPIERCLVMWVDASVQKFPPKKEASRIAASAVRYLDASTEQRWVESVALNTLHHGSKFAFETGYIAITEAFRIAYTLTEHFDRLVVLSDCQNALRSSRMQGRSTALTKPGLVDALFFYANSFYDSGIAVEIRWVPAHVGVEGNERVDVLATQIRRSAQFILGREAPNYVVKDLTLTSSSRGSFRRALLATKSICNFQGQEEEGSHHEGRMIGDKILDSEDELSNQLPTLSDIAPFTAAIKIRTRDRRAHGERIKKPSPRVKKRKLPVGGNRKKELKYWKQILRARFMEMERNRQSRIDGGWYRLGIISGVRIIHSPVL